MHPIKQRITEDICVTSPDPLRRQFDSPVIKYKSWNDSKAGTPIRPLNYFLAFRHISAKSAGMWRDANSAQIEAVRIPTCLNRDIRMSPFVCMPLAGKVQQVEFMIFEVEHAASKFCREISTSQPMIMIRAFVDAT